MNPVTETETILATRKKLKEYPQWNSWKFQLQNRIKRENLQNYFVLTEEEKKGISNSIRLNVGALLIILF